MANLVDYLDWRGDLTLDRSPFNEVDNLILAELSFVDFKGVVPPPGEGRPVPLHVAAEGFFARFPQGEEIDMGVLVPAAIPDMLRKMAASARFRDMGLSCFVDQLDVEKGEQFAALTIHVGDGPLYLSFRGTDDTLAGWREDFELACLPEVPAQKKALAYTCAVARQYPRRKIRLGGHSKGGNLAVYAGVFCPETVQRRIAAIWSNDGPGFHEDLLSLPEHQRMEDRIFSIVPKSSVVGMLLEHEEPYTVVDSDQHGLMQHDGFSWQVLGPGFVTLHQVSREAHLSDMRLRGWVQSLSVEQRASFVDALFAVLSASGAVTLTDLKTDSLKAVSAMVKAMKELKKETRDGLLDFVWLLFTSDVRLTLEGMQEESEKKKPGKGKTRKKKKEGEDTP